MEEGWGRGGDVSKGREEKGGEGRELEHTRPLKHKRGTDQMWHFHKFPLRSPWDRGEGGGGGGGYEREREGEGGEIIQGL